MLQSPQTLAAAIGMPVDDAAYLLNVCTVSGEQGAAVLAEMGLLPVNGELEATARSDHPCTSVCRARARGQHRKAQSRTSRTTRSRETCIANPRWEACSGCRAGLKGSVRELHESSIYAELMDMSNVRFELRRR